MIAKMLLFFISISYIDSSWSAPRTVAKNVESQAVGYYSNGSLKNGVKLAQTGSGFYRLFPKQEVRYGVDEMISVLTNSARIWSEQYPDSERLQIGDISAVQGGKLSNHSSHQNGLDADLIYFRTDRREQELDLEIEFQEHFVIDEKISNNFDVERNWEFFKLLMSMARVNRIFIDQKIKDELCRLAESLDELESHKETLRRLRHWPNHDDHFHLRLECPSEDSECVVQELPPEGHGCNL